MITSTTTVAAYGTAVAARVATSGSNARLLTGARAAAETEGAGEQIGAVFNAIELVIIFGAALAILNTLTMAVAQRRRLHLDRGAGARLSSQGLSRPGGR